MPNATPRWPPGLTEALVVHEAPLDIRRYRCCPCHAVVQVLPGFVARNLRRTWPTVEAVEVRPTRRAPVAVAGRTARRWRERAASPARPVLHVLSSLRPSWRRH